jgi:hypothetical protein
VSVCALGSGEQDVGVLRDGRIAEVITEVTFIKKSEIPFLTVFGDLSAVGFKPMVASEKLPGGFDSHPLPFTLL